jgi:hypothetical protein
MFHLFFLLLQKIRNQLALRKEHKRIREIKEALQSYAIRRGINQNNNERNNLWKI